MTGNGPRVLHVITGLGPGGAEILLVRLLEELGEERVGHQVLSLVPARSEAARVEELGVPVTSLGMKPRPTPADVIRLGRFLRKSRAEVIQTWMLHSNVLGGLTARAVGRSPVVWGVHVSDMDRSIQGATAVALQRIEAISSWFVPSRIVACATSARTVMERMHYRRGRVVTILNGFDTERLKPDPATRGEVRDELGIPPEAVLVGHAARFHPMKDHRTLLLAAGRVLERAPETRFVLCGGDVSLDNPELAPLAEPLGDRVQLLGHRPDLPRILNACDLAVHSSSIGEALPLAIGEAMAMGLPVVATRCGDAEEIIGDTGETTPVKDPDALADAMLRLIAMAPEERSRLGEMARDRIREHYSLAGMAKRYREVWKEAL